MFVEPATSIAPLAHRTTLEAEGIIAIVDTHARDVEGVAQGRVGAAVEHAHPDRRRATQVVDTGGPEAALPGTTLARRATRFAHPAVCARQDAV
jgi:hypothetical protein